MERLTKATDDLSFLCNHLRRETKFNAQRVKDIHDHLAAYEDTGLEPEEIKLMKEREEWQPFEKITSAFGVPLDRICELAEADRDGRCAVLPCKVGDTVYAIKKYGGKPIAIIDDKVQMVGVTSRTVRILLRAHHDHNQTFQFGKTVFLTRESAEAAIKAGDHR